MSIRSHSLFGKTFADFEAEIPFVFFCDAIETRLDQYSAETLSIMDEFGEDVVGRIGVLKERNKEDIYMLLNFFIPFEQDEDTSIQSLTYLCDGLILGGARYEPTYQAYIKFLYNLHQSLIKRSLSKKLTPGGRRDEICKDKAKA